MAMIKLGNELVNCGLDLLKLEKIFLIHGSKLVNHLIKRGNEFLIQGHDLIKRGNKLSHGNEFLICLKTKQIKLF